MQISERIQLLFSLRPVGKQRSPRATSSWSNEETKWKFCCESRGTRYWCSLVETCQSFLKKRQELSVGCLIRSRSLANFEQRNIVEQLHYSGTTACCEGCQAVTCQVLAPRARVPVLLFSGILHEYLLYLSSPFILTLHCTA